MVDLGQQLAHTKAVDASGLPMTVYHGTDAAHIDEFYADVVWFSESPSVASAYAIERRSGVHSRASQPNVIPVYVDVRTPMVLPFDMNASVDEALRSLADLGWDVRLFAGYVQGAYEIVRSYEFVREARARGFDGIRALERGEWTWGVFEGNQVYSKFGGLFEAPLEDRADLTPPTPRLSLPRRARPDPFEEWSHGHRLVSAAALNPKFYAGQGVVVEVMHGTMSDFSEFDPANAAPDGDLGAGFYFTNSAADAGENYADFGPDRAMRYERVHDQVSWEVSDEGGKLPDEEFEAEVTRRVYDRMGITGAVTMPVFVRFDNPVVIGGYSETMFSWCEEGDRFARSNVANSLNDVLSAIENVQASGMFTDLDVVEVSSAVRDSMTRGHIGAKDLIKQLKASMGNVEDVNGDLVSGEVIRLALQRCGFDGFIDHTVVEKFGSASAGLPMAGMDGETIHFIAFEPTQIKSAIGNSGAYDADDADIRFSYPGNADARQGTGDPANPYDFSSDERFHHLFYGTPGAGEVADFSRWLRARPNDYVRMYHGTSASLPIHEQGLLATTASRRNSLQSASGFVCLSAFPGMAFEFGRYSSLNRGQAADGARVAVYPVTVTVRRLLADLDQLANRRNFAGEQVGNTLAESLVRGRGARVRGKIDVGCIALAARYIERDVLVGDVNRIEEHLEPELDMVRFSFAGTKARGADLVALSIARAHHGEEPPEKLRRETGWFRGADEKWRFEIDDSEAKVLPAIKSLARGSHPPRDIDSVVHRLREDGLYDITLNPVKPQNISEFVCLVGLKHEVIEALVPADVAQAISQGQGNEDFIGDLEPALRLDRAFRFDGFDALPLSHVLHHPKLFAAYPGVADVMVRVNPTIGYGASLGELSDGTHVITLGLREQLRCLMHEVQHRIQSIEGFALGGTIELFERRRSQTLPFDILNAAIAIRALADKDGRCPEVLRPYAPRFLREQSPKAWALAKERDMDALNAEMELSRMARLPTESYIRLAGEVEARNVESRLGLTAAERRGVAPKATADTAVDDQLVMFSHGGEITPSAMPGRESVQAASRWRG